MCRTTHDLDVAGLSADAGNVAMRRLRAQSLLRSIVADAQSGQAVAMPGAGIFPKPPSGGVIYAYATGKPPTHVKPDPMTGTDCTCSYEDSEEMTCHARLCAITLAAEQSGQDAALAARADYLHREWSHLDAHDENAAAAGWDAAMNYVRSGQGVAMPGAGDYSGTTMTPELLMAFRHDLAAITNTRIPAWLVEGAKLCAATLAAVRAASQSGQGVKSAGADVPLADRVRAAADVVFNATIRRPGNWLRISIPSCGPERTKRIEMFTALLGAPPTTVTAESVEWKAEGRSGLAPEHAAAPAALDSCPTCTMPYHHTTHMEDEPCPKAQETTE